MIDYDDTLDCCLNSNAFIQNISRFDGDEYVKVTERIHGYLGAYDHCHLVGRIILENQHFSLHFRKRRMGIGFHSALLYASYTTSVV
jgi:hypothetical protein